MELFYETWGGWILGFVFVSVLVCNCVQYRKLAAAKTTRFKFFLFPVLYLIISPIIYVSFPLLAIYRQIVQILLSLKHGPKFAGLLDGSDVIFALENNTPIQLLFVIQYKKSDSRTFCEVVEETIHKAFLTKLKEDPKPLGSVQKSLGYYYLLKEQVTFDDCFKKLKVVNSSTSEITKAELTRLMSECSEMPLPKNNTGLWDVLVGTQSITWKTNVKDDTIKYYPIVFRMNHALADAMHILKNVLGVFADLNMKESQISHNLKTTSKTTIKKHDIASEIENLLKLIANRFIYYLKLSYTIFMGPSVLFVNAILMNTEANIKHAPHLTHEKILCLNVEEEYRYLKTIKNIKRKHPGTSFEDVFLTAVTASLGEYFKQHRAQLPEYLVAEVPVVLDALQVMDLSLNELKKKKLKCKNNLSACMRKLPVSIASDGINSNLINILNFIAKERKIVRNSTEIGVYHWMMNTGMSLLTAPLIKMFLKEVYNQAVIVSNVPGWSHFSVMDGCLLEDAIPFNSNRGRAGIGVIIQTYGGRVQLSLIVDKAVISSEEEAQNILNNVYKYLDLLDCETDRNI